MYITKTNNAIIYLHRYTQVQAGTHNFHVVYVQILSVRVQAPLKDSGCIVASSSWARMRAGTGSTSSWRFGLDFPGQILRKTRS